MLSQVLIAAAVAIPAAQAAAFPGMKAGDCKSEHKEVCVDYTNDCDVAYGGCYVPECEDEPEWEVPTCEVEAEEEDEEDCDDEEEEYEEDEEDCDDEEDEDDEDEEGDNSPVKPTITETYTMVHTITSCEPEVTECPVRPGGGPVIVTEEITTTWCPGEEYTTYETEIVTVTDCGHPDGGCGYETKSHPVVYTHPTYVPTGYAGGHNGPHPGPQGPYETKSYEHPGAAHPTGSHDVPVVGGCSGYDCYPVPEEKETPAPTYVAPTPTGAVPESPSTPVTEEGDNSPVFTGGVGRLEVSCALVGLAGVVAALL